MHWTDIFGGIRRHSCRTP